MTLRIKTVISVLAKSYDTIVQIFKEYDKSAFIRMISMPVLDSRALPMAIPPSVAMRLFDMSRYAKEEFPLSASAIAFAPVAGKT